MGSAFLYVAIVVMWLSVLLPMWLRRDRHTDDVYEEPASPEAEEAVDEQVAEADTIVQVPERDRSKGEETAEAGEVSVTSAVTSSAASSEAYAPGEPPAEQPPVARPVRPRGGRGRRRAHVLALRRRRLLWSILLVLASVVTAAVRVVPWWAVAPSGVLLAGYLLVLRAAVRVDREQREKAVRARAEHLRRMRERRAALAAMAREAEIIEFEARRRNTPVFDQYAEGRRAVGD